MLPKDRKNLLLLADAKFRVSAVLLLFAGILIAWLLVGGEDEEPQLIDSVASIPEVVWQRRAQADSIRLAPLIKRIGGPVDVENGEKVFKYNCGACHKVDMNLTGPALKGVLDRAPQPSLEWLIAFLTNEDSLVKAKEPYTLALRQNWGQTIWTHRADGMSKQQVIDLIAWIEYHR